jgi:nitrite reductase (NO-forming)
MSPITQEREHHTVEELELLLEEELEHGRDLEERTERLEMRSGLFMVLAVAAASLVMIAAVVMIFTTGRSATSTEKPTSAAPAAAAGDSGGGEAHAARDASTEAAPVKGVERFERVNPELPAIPAGAVKKFKVDVYEHVTRVSKTAPPTQVWSYAINGKYHRGTGVSEPMVVTQGDMVEITLVNGGSKAANVTFPHSIDYHSSEIAPNKAFKTIQPGETHVFSFEAKHAGVFMYHCATDPVLLHTGAGMVGMMVVKPKDLAPVDKELWITQQEFYVGEPGKIASQAKMEAKTPDVIAFNGFGAQYKDHPITVEKGEKVRMYVLNAGPSIWSAFHVIGTVFDKTMVEGTPGKSAQTINLAPSQGGWVEFTLDDEGTFPFVTHAFGDMVTGAVGVLRTDGAPKGKGGH